MKTFKKLFSVSAIVALLGTLAPFYAFGATYSDELQEAYEYAYAKNVTTMTSIDNANMYGSLTRIAMAKMIANYATTVLNLEEVDNAGECTFSDVTASLDAQYDNGVTNACKLGLMGQNITAFRPNDPVTRGEFGTTLSRALNRANGNTIEEGTPYYENHLAYLKSEGIMNDISNPSATEVRGYVMLMMMRADDGYVAPADSGKCTLTERVDCILNADDTEACIAACSGDSEEEEEVEGRTEQGTLKVSEASVQPSATAVAGVPAIEVGTIKLTAGDEDVNLYSISLEGMGTTAFASITDVALQNKDGVKVTRTKSLNNKGEAKISFVSDYTLKAGSSENLTIIATIAGAGNGNTVAFKVTDFEGPAKVNGTPVTTQYVTMTTNANLGRLDVIANPADTTKVKLGEEATLGRFSVKPDNKNEDLTIKSITLKQIGTIKTSYLDELYLTVNGNKVSSKFMIDRDNITFTTDIALDKADNSNVDVVLKGIVTEGLGDNVRFTIENAGDVVVEGQKYGTRVNVLKAGGAWAGTLALNPAAIAVQGTAISVSFDKTDTESTLATSKANFGTLKLKAESSDYSFDKMYLELATACTDGDKLEDVKIVDVTLGGDSYVGTPLCDTNTFSIEFDDVDMSAGVSRNLPLIVEFEDATPTKTYLFNIELNDDEVLTDVANDKTYHSTDGTEQTEMNKLLSSSSFTTRTITVEEGGLTISHTSLKKQEIVLANGKEITFGLGQFKVTNVEKAFLKSLKIDATSDYVDANNNPLKLEDVASKAYLTVDGTSYEGEIDNDSITFSDTVELGKGTTTDFELSLVLRSKDVKAKAGLITNTSTFSIVAYTYKVGNNTIERSASSTVPLTPIVLSQTQGFEIVSAGTLAIDENVSDSYTNVDKTVLAGSENVVLGRFKVNASQENIKVKKLTMKIVDESTTPLTTADIKDTFKNVRMATLSGEEFVTIPATLTTAENVANTLVLNFDEMNYIAEKAATQYIYLIADVNAVDKTAGGLTEAQPVNVTVALDTTAATKYKIIGDSSNADITPTNGGTITKSKKTSVRANVPVSIELEKVTLTLGDNVLVGKLHITMADQDVNKVDEGILDAVLSTLTITATPVGAGVQVWDYELGTPAYVGTATDGAIKIRKDGTSSAIARPAAYIAANAEDVKLPAGKTVTYNLYAKVNGGTSDNPGIQLSIADKNTNVVINEYTAGEVTKLTIGNGVTPETSVTSTVK